MSLTALRPVIYTTEFKETVSFYDGVFGFKCIALREDLGWAAVKRDNVEINISIPNAHFGFSRPHFTGSFYIITTNVEKLWLEFKDTARVCYPLEVFDYGMREFAVYDNNGYLLQFGQEI